MLTTVELTDGRWAVATRTSLHLVDEAGDVHHTWSDVDRGSLEAQSRVLTVHWVDGTTSSLPLSSDRNAPRFAQVFRERVQQSVVHDRQVTLPGGRLVRVALRRGPAGRLFTQVLGDEGVDLDDPAVASAVDAAEDQVREAAGLLR
ncbi:hypothetical protein CSO01_05780 [Cellulomonas soli]|uniref:Uncharacterized protein n=1 Tax=Cellulomonas soli TaxID=931535 RepID=A0A512P9I1_9CELL|nr:hypothetical protein CSO01_05780 [Cellulomonas soli]